MLVSSGILYIWRLNIEIEHLKQKLIELTCPTIDRLHPHGQTRYRKEMLSQLSN